MACQAKNKSCCEQIERKNITSRSGLFGIVKNIFKLNQTRSTANIPLNNAARRAETYQKILIQTQIGAAQAQVKRLQMVQ